MVKNKTAYGTRKSQEGHVLTVVETVSNQAAKIDKTSTYLTEEEA
jgi:hypothetical protein